MTRYHPVLVALHWLMAILIVLVLFGGTFLLDGVPNDDPAKMMGFQAHMALGLAIGALLILRLGVRYATAKPPHAQTGNALLDKVGAATHWVLYLLVAGMVGSGLGTALSAGLFPIVYGGSGDPIVADLSIYTPRVVHGIIASVLMALLALHAAAALYHQFGLKDGLFRRMWFGKRP